MPSLAPTALAVLALSLLAGESTRTERRPVVSLFGLLLGGVAVLARILAGHGLLATTAALFLDAGCAFLAAALWLRRRPGDARTFLLLGAFALVMAALLGGAQRALAPRPAETTTLLLELGPDDRIEEVAALLRRHDARYERAFPALRLADDEDLAQVYLVEVAASEAGPLMAALRRDAENVDYAVPNRRVGLAPEPARALPAPAPTRVLADDPLASSQWALEAVRAHDAHALLRSQTVPQKARVAILDTGVDGVHEDLAGIFQASPAARDENGHGTHCAGIAGAATNNGRGMASLNWEGRFVDVVGYPALGPTGFGTLESIAQAILDATGDGADVVSLSLGEYPDETPEVVADAVAFALRRGVVVVASAGNERREATDHMPSNLPGVIAVTALDRSLERARFSNTAATLERVLAAPGVDIVSLAPGGGYVARSGTSMAAPLVAGLAGLVRAFAPGLSPAEVYDVLHGTGTDLPDSRRLGRLIDADAAVRHVLGQPAPTAAR